MSDLMRVLVVEAAEGQLGKSDPRPYYLDTCGPNPWNWPKHWCGIFALWCLHRAGLALDWRWVISTGFLSKLRRTLHPRPGDIAYFTRAQHHAVVVDVADDGKVVTTVDGNAGWPTPKVKRKTRKAKSVTAFYSIASLLPTAQVPVGTLPAVKWRTVLKRGDQGPDVKAWQRELLRRGYDLGKWQDDGDFGGLTEAATVRFQRQAGLCGRVDERTRKAVGL